MKKLIEINPIEDRQELLDLRRSEKLGCSISVNYIYFLTEEFITYPSGQSAILYIGEAMRKSENTGVRFVQHITPKKETGSDSGNNLILSHFFHNNWKIGLVVFESNQSRKLIEREMIYWHIQQFGAPPIAQGKIPLDKKGKNRNKDIFEYLESNKQSVAKNGDFLRNINNRV
ncbi:HNH endonuclease [Flammeovirga yaeyamensis]|uniref:HNH endonuclease n=1 Tax=Flammeovirga yaeyamensis TaxID=367791 RepID=A0AAX1ND01_9BACT|nr:HNH endonuclease signature motif containing protein [Flammeovirga yaeyamensis]MBB3696559.1 hypothetical protein [Flammeovirga yaeyamensis]NMF33237.1 HNH endonuclease [Flammeovirga yaeyamensis]QWG05484.1 HNH endonuclease [Flammeovirga yaeyamensis]